MHYLNRLRLLAPLTAVDEAALRNAFDDAIRLPTDTPFATGAGAIIVATGWAGLVREDPNGRCCTLQLAFPGDVIRPLRRTGVHWRALTPVTIFQAPDDVERPGLAQAYQRSARIDALNYESQIARLGMMSSVERYADLLVEIDARLGFAGHRTGEEFHLPLTQLSTGQILGITGVHINRTRRALSDDRLAILGHGTAELSDELWTRSLERQRQLLRA